MVYLSKKISQYLPRFSYQGNPPALVSADYQSISGLKLISDKNYAKENFEIAYQSECRQDEGENNL